jgi:hypothetical protein
MKLQIDLPVKEFKSLMYDLGYFWSDNYGWESKNYIAPLEVLKKHGIDIKGDD